MTTTDPPPLGVHAGEKSLAAWGVVRQMIDDMTAMVRAGAETELELIEGLRVLARATALCAELSLDVDPAQPWFFDMNSEARYIGGPNPDGAYHLAMIDGRRGYRVDGRRGTGAYLGFQVLAGSGLTPRRMAAHLSDRDLVLDEDGRFSFVLSTDEPPAAAANATPWVRIPADASAIVVRQYVSDPALEDLATFDITPLDDAGPPDPPTDSLIADQLTAMAWTIWKLTTLHQTIRPDLLDRPNVLDVATAADLGAADTTPDNLYMIGTFRLDPGEALLLDIDPPPSRYWSVTLENIWHECIDVRRRRSSMTNAMPTPGPDGRVRVIISAEDPGAPNWLDTGRRHRGFVVLRWLDNPDPPDVTTSVITLP